MKEYKLAIIAAILTSGCVSLSSITSTQYQSVSVQALQQDAKSEFIGANCELSNKRGKWYLTTPGTVMIPRSNDDLQIVCRKAELKPGKATVVSETRPLIYGNILVGGGIGALVDLNNGAGYAYPESIQIVMGKETRIDPTIVSEPAEGKEKTPIAIVKQKFQPEPSGITELSSKPSASLTFAVEPSKVETITKSMKTQSDLSLFKYKMLRGDECDDFISNGDFCWWSPPGNYSNCPVTVSLKMCKEAYGQGCRMQHGKEFPTC